MPRTPVDYSKTIIYKLVHKEDFNNENIYIGSTTDFTRRKNEHKRTCNNENRKGYNEKKYQYIRANGGWEEWEMVLVERHNCNDGNEARSREEYWRSYFNSQLNTNRAYGTEEKKIYDKEYRERNKDKILEYQKERYERNKEKILEKNSQQINCICGCVIIKRCLTQHKKTQKHIELLDAIPNNDI